MNICVHHHVHTNFTIYHYQGSLSFLVIKFKVISRFCKVQKGHFPGLISDNFGTKRQTSKCSKNILCFIHVCCPILGFIHVCCPILGFIQIFLLFLGKFQAISGPGQITFKSPGFPGYARNTVLYSVHLSQHARRFSYIFIGILTLRW